MNSNAEQYPRTRRRTLLFIALLAAASFLYLACAVEGGVTQVVDETVLLALRSADDRALPGGPEWLLPFAAGITHLGSGYVLAAIAVITVILLVRRKHYRTALRFAAVAVGGMVFLYAVKAGVARPRPTVVPHLIEIGEYSFPSGHAMMTSALFLSLASLAAAARHSVLTRTGIYASAALLSALIGCTRVYLGVHYPSDVFAGWGAGLMLFCLFTLSKPWDTDRRRPVNG